ncbi:MAG: hypothetical protein HY619_05525 [Thaumarchaeota archaeon]|nr:hypothetical protein [Nitrososphaerota archaeon]
MPEIWLNYGAVEVNVDIKAENLGVTIETKPTAMDNSAFDAEISSIPIEDNTLLVTPKPDAPTTKVLNMILSKIDRQRTPNIAVATHQRSLSALRRTLEGTGHKVVALSSNETIETTDSYTVKKPQIFNEYNTKMLLSSARLDPLFGFDGGPVSLLRSIDENFVPEALTRHGSNEPSPGQPTKASDLAMTLAEHFGEISSTEIVSSGEEVSAIFTGNLKTTHIQASNHLRESADYTLSEPVRSMLISPGNESAGSSLYTALKSVWNVIGGLRDNGTVVLLAECSQGLGCEAFIQYVTGKLPVEKALDKGTYIEGLEELQFLQHISSKFNLVVVSTLPRYYVEAKLGLRSAGRASEALNHLYSTQGARTKVCVVPNASENLITIGKRADTTNVNP